MRLALGTAQFGLDYGVANQAGRPGLGEVRTILEYGRARGLDVLDTAVDYGDCIARLGEIGVEGWDVVSKLPAVPAACGDVVAWVTTTVEKSLTQLGIKRLYALLLHRPQQLRGPHGELLYEALLRLKRDGLVRKIGISIYDPQELDLLVGSFPPDIVQAPFNVLDRRLLESGWLDRLAAQRVEVHTRSVFLQGLLLLAPEARPKKFDRWLPTWERWDSWLAETGVSAVQGSLNFVLSFAAIDKVVVGVDSAAQLAEIIDASLAASPPVPDSLKESDSDLVNPSNWATLA